MNIQINVFMFGNPIHQRKNINAILLMQASLGPLNPVQLTHKGHSLPRIMSTLYTRPCDVVVEVPFHSKINISLRGY